MVENMPIGLLADLMRWWTVPAVTAAAATSSTSSLSGASTTTTTTPSKSPKGSAELNRNTYSDCEKKHFLDVAYENNWGTTVAANKFTRIWGKGPTRRMFYWWREQFKKEHDREQKVLDELRERKTELSLEFHQISTNTALLAERGQQVLQKIAAIDSEIGIIVGKRHKSMCSITGDPCVHGDGLQEDTSTIVRKFTTPFTCDFCKMPFQKESTCFIHMRLCQTRHVAQSDGTASDANTISVTTTTPATIETPAATSPPTMSTIHVDLLREKYNTELTELAEQLIAKLQAAASTSAAISY